MKITLIVLNSLLGLVFLNVSIAQSQNSITLIGEVKVGINQQVAKDLSFDEFKDVTLEYNGKVIRPTKLDALYKKNNKRADGTKLIFDFLEAEINDQTRQKVNILNMRIRITYEKYVPPGTSAKPEIWTTIGPLKVPITNRHELTEGVFELKDAILLGEPEEFTIPALLRDIDRTLNSYSDNIRKIENVSSKQDKYELTINDILSLAELKSYLNDNVTGSQSNNVSVLKEEALNLKNKLDQRSSALANPNLDPETKNSYIQDLLRISDLYQSFLLRISYYEKVSALIDLNVLQNYKR